MLVKPKAIVKMIVDACMTLALLFLMGYQFWGETAHEWVGAGIFVLFIAHHILNLNWYKTLCKGKYMPARIFQLLIDLLVFLAMLGLMVSGIMLSRRVFAFLQIRGGMSFARMLHMAASYWGFILMALHLGLHWNMIMGLARKAHTIRKPSEVRSIVLIALGIGIAVYGLYAFINRDFLIYLLLKTHFVFMDFEEPIPFYYLDYLAIMGLFVFIAHYLSKLLRKVGLKHKEKAEGTT